MTRLLLAALTVSLVACGGDDADVEGDPAGALRDAVSALGDLDGIELVMTLQADEEARAAAVTESDLTEEEIERLLGARLEVRATGGAEGEDGSGELVVVFDDQPVVEARMLPETELYLRVDAPAILDALDDPDASRTFDELSGQAAMFGLGEVLQAVQDGGWIHLVGAEQLANFFGAEPAPESTPDEEEQQRLSEELSAATVRFLDGDVEVAHVGSEDAGERVRATTDGAALQRYLTELQTIVASSDALGVAPDDVVTGFEDELSDDTQVTVDAWIRDGRLAQIGVDLAALDATDDVPGELLLVVAIEDFGGGIEAPSEATELDLFGLLGGFLGGFDDGPALDLDAADDTATGDGGTDGPEGAADLPADLTGEDCLPPEVLEQLGEEERAQLEPLLDSGLLGTC